MNLLEDYLRKATEPGPGRRLPGAVLVVANKDGECRISYDMRGDRKTIFCHKGEKDDCEN